MRFYVEADTRHVPHYRREPHKPPKPDGWGEASIEVRGYAVRHGAEPDDICTTDRADVAQRICDLLNTHGLK